MPRTNIDYSKTSIYKICCKDLNITEIYVGHTTDMRKRKYTHKSSCNNEKYKNYNLNVYQFIRANGNWNNWDMIEVERYNAIDGYDATKRERYWIEELKATLNIQLPTRTSKEYEENRKENRKEYEKNYNEKRKEYYEKNKQKILEKRNEKITCECGCLIRRNGLAEHKKTKKHIKLMSKKEDIQ